MRSWEDESLLRRPPQEDSCRHRAAGYAKSPSCSPVRCEPFLCLKRYARSSRRGEPLTPKKSPGRPRKADEKARVLLEEDVKERPAATIGQRRRFLEHITAMTLSDSTVRRLMKRLGFSQKNGLWGRWNALGVLKMCLEGYGRRASGGQAAALRRRDGDEHLAFSFVRLGSQG